MPHGYAHDPREHVSRCGVHRGQSPMPELLVPGDALESVYDKQFHIREGSQAEVGNGRPRQSAVRCVLQDSAGGVRGVRPSHPVGCRERSRCDSLGWAEPMALRIVPPLGRCAGAYANFSSGEGFRHELEQLREAGLQSGRVQRRGDPSTESRRSETPRQRWT